jgi:hypothetical protein
MCLRYVESELSYSILSNSDTFGALRYRTPQNQGRPPEKAILASRLIDRPLRPLFPSWLRDDLQVSSFAFFEVPQRKQ